MSEVIQFDVQEGVARATLNRPEAYNAVDGAMAVAWNSMAHEVVDRADIACLVLAARGKAFSAGGDLRAMAVGGSEQVFELAALLHDGILALVSSSKPVLAVVEGVVAGGGLGLLLTSDYAVAAENASFAVRYANVGLSPDMSVSTLLARAVGERRALQLALQDRTLSAHEALDWGLVAEVLPAQDVAERSREIAAAWAANREAVGQAKRLIRSGIRRDLGETLADEQRTIAELFDSAEAQARIGRFVNRER